MKSKMSLIKSVIEFLVANQKLVIAVAISLLVIINFQYFALPKGPTCLGVVDSKEVAISFDSPVVVKRLFVLPGERVQKGQPLLEVDMVGVSLKLSELESTMKSLEVEEKLRSGLIEAFRGEGETRIGSDDDRGSKQGPNSPLSHEIEGLRQQISQLKKVQAQSFRFSEDDGIVASISFQANEQVAPFQSIMTLTPVVPNLVYGFLHENYVSEFGLGDEVEVVGFRGESAKRAKGAIVSMGNRIVSFPERLQTLSASPFWGRELVVSLQDQSSFLMGEKVQIKAAKKTGESHGTGTIAYANSVTSSSRTEIKPFPLASQLPFEASGLSVVLETGQLLTAADEDGPLKSPFWLHPLKNIGQAKNLVMRGIDGIEDVESLSFSEGFYYAMSSMGLTKSGKSKRKRNLLIRFKLIDSHIDVDRVVVARDSLIEVVRGNHGLQELSGKIEEDLDIESLSVFEGDAYFALKSPQLKGGLSIVFVVKDFVRNMEDRQPVFQSAEVYALLKLKDHRCKKPSRITDLLKTKTGLIILSNCSPKSEFSQVWWIANNASSGSVKMVASLNIGNLEGLALLEDSDSLILSSDGGLKRGSDYYQLQIPRSLYEHQTNR